MVLYSHSCPRLVAESLSEIEALGLGNSIGYKAQGIRPKAFRIQHLAFSIQHLALIKHLE